jgi:hypothetical protein
MTEFPGYSFELRVLQTRPVKLVAGYNRDELVILTQDTLTLWRNGRESFATKYDCSVPPTALCIFPPCGGYAISQDINTIVIVDENFSTIWTHSLKDIIITKVLWVPLLECLVVFGMGSNIVVIPKSALPPLTFSEENARMQKWSIHFSPKNDEVLSFTYSSSHLYVLTRNSCIYIVSLEKKEKVAVLRNFHPDGVSCCAYNPKTESLFVGSNSGVIRQYYLVGYTKKFQAELQGPHATIAVLYIHESGAHMISVSEGGQMILWNLLAKTRVSTFSLSDVAFGHPKRSLCVKERFAPLVASLLPNQASKLEVLVETDNRKKERTFVVLPVANAAVILRLNSVPELCYRTNASDYLVGAYPLHWEEHDPYVMIMQRDGYLLVLDTSIGRIVQKKDFKRTSMKEKDVIINCFFDALTCTSVFMWLDGTSRMIEHSGTLDNSLPRLSLECSDSFKCLSVINLPKFSASSAAAVLHRGSSKVHSPGGERSVLGMDSDGPGKKPVLESALKARVTFLGTRHGYIYGASYDCREWRIFRRVFSEEGEFVVILGSILRERADPTVLDSYILYTVSCFGKLIFLDAETLDEIDSLQDDALSIDDCTSCVMELPGGFIVRGRANGNLDCFSVLQCYEHRKMVVMQSCDSIHDTAVVSMAMSAKGEFVASLDDENGLCVWSSHDMTLLQFFQLGDRPSAHGFVGENSVWILRGQSHFLIAKISAISTRKPTKTLVNPLLKRKIQKRHSTTLTFGDENILARRFSAELDHRITDLLSSYVNAKKYAKIWGKDHPLYQEDFLQDDSSGFERGVGKTLYSLAEKTEDIYDILNEFEFRQQVLNIRGMDASFIDFLDRLDDENKEERLEIARGQIEKFIRLHHEIQKENIPVLAREHPRSFMEDPIAVNNFVPVPHEPREPSAAEISSLKRIDGFLEEVSAFKRKMLLMQIYRQEYGPRKIGYSAYERAIFYIPKAFCLALKKSEISPEQYASMDETDLESLISYITGEIMRLDSLQPVISAEYEEPLEIVATKPATTNVRYQDIAVREPRHKTILESQDVLFPNAVSPFKLAKASSRLKHHRAQIKGDRKKTGSTLRTLKTHEWLDMQIINQHVAESLLHDIEKLGNQHYVSTVDLEYTKTLTDHSKDEVRPISLKDILQHKDLHIDSVFNVMEVARSQPPVVHELPKIVLESTASVEQEECSQSLSPTSMISMDSENDLSFSAEQKRFSFLDREETYFAIFTSSEEDLFSATHRTATSDDGTMSEQLLSHSHSEGHHGVKVSISLPAQYSSMENLAMLQKKIQLTQMMTSKSQSESIDIAVADEWRRFFSSSVLAEFAAGSWHLKKVSQPVEGRLHIYGLDNVDFDVSEASARDSLVLSTQRDSVCSNSYETESEPELKEYTMPEINPDSFPFQNLHFNSVPVSEYQPISEISEMDSSSRSGFDDLFSSSEQVGAEKSSSDGDETSMILGDVEELSEEFPEMSKLPSLEEQSEASQVLSNSWEDASAASLPDEATHSKVRTKKQDDDDGEEEDISSSEESLAAGFQELSLKAPISSIGTFGTNQFYEFTEEEKAASLTVMKEQIQRTAKKTNWVSATEEEIIQDPGEQTQWPQKVVDLTVIENKKLLCETIVRGIDRQRNCLDLSHQCECQVEKVIFARSDVQFEELDALLSSINDGDETRDIQILDFETSTDTKNILEHCEKILRVLSTTASLGMLKEILIFLDDHDVHPFSTLQVVGRNLYVEIHAFWSSADLDNPSSYDVLEKLLESTLRKIRKDKNILSLHFPNRRPDGAIINSDDEKEQPVAVENVPRASVGVTDITSLQERRQILRAGKAKVEDTIVGLSLEAVWDEILQMKEKLEKQNEKPFGLWSHTVEVEPQTPYEEAVIFLSKCQEDLSNLLYSMESMDFEMSAKSFQLAVGQLLPRKLMKSIMTAKGENGKVGVLSLRPELAVIHNHTQILLFDVPPHLPEISGQLRRLKGTLVRLETFTQQMRTIARGLTFSLPISPMRDTIVAFLKAIQKVATLVAAQSILLKQPKEIVILPEPDDDFESSDFESEASPKMTSNEPQEDNPEWLEMMEEEVTEAEVSKLHRQQAVQKRQQNKALAAAAEKQRFISARKRFQAKTETLSSLLNEVEETSFPAAPPERTSLPSGLMSNDFKRKMMRWIEDIEREDMVHLLRLTTKCQKSIPTEDDVILLRQQYERKKRGNSKRERRRRRNEEEGWSAEKELLFLERIRQLREDYSVMHARNLQFSEDDFTDRLLTLLYTPVCIADDYELGDGEFDRLLGDMGSFNHPADWERLERALEVQMMSERAYLFKSNQSKQTTPAAPPSSKADRRASRPCIAVQLDVGRAGNALDYLPEDGDIPLSKLIYCILGISGSV